MKKSAENGEMRRRDKPDIIYITPYVDTDNADIFLYKSLRSMFFFNLKSS